MAFSPPVVGCLVKKRLAKGGVTGTPGPPWLRPWVTLISAILGEEELEILIVF